MLKTDIKSARAAGRVVFNQSTVAHVQVGGRVNGAAPERRGIFEQDTVLDSVAPPVRPAKMLMAPPSRETLCMKRERDTCTAAPSATIDGAPEIACRVPLEDAVPDARE